MKLLLCGGGCGEQTVEANKKFNEIIDHDKPILYVPLAMNPEKHPYEGCLEWFTDEMKDVDFPWIEMAKTFEELASKNYHDYSAIFIGGGNTFKLLKGLKESGAFTKIKEYIYEGGIVYGGSAGAIIFGNDINSCASMDLNDGDLKDTKGFDVLNGISIFAHYTNEKTEDIHEKYKDALKKYSIKNGEVVALPEEDTIYIEDGDVELIGSRPYYEFINGEEIKKEIINTNEIVRK